MSIIQTLQWWTKYERRDSPRLEKGRKLITAVPTLQLRRLLVQQPPRLLVSSPADPFVTFDIKMDD